MRPRLKSAAMMTIGQRRQLEALRGDLLRASRELPSPLERAEASMAVLFADQLLDGRLRYAFSETWIDSASLSAARWKASRLHPDDALCCAEVSTGF